MASSIEVPVTLRRAGEQPRVSLPPRDELSKFFTLVMPQIVDCEVTGRCPYSCVDCQGPDHYLRDELDAQEWQAIFGLLHMFGTSRFVITGGEPLARADITEILESVPGHDGHCDAGLTLSTTGIGLLTDKSSVLDILARRKHSELGLPIDAADPGVNARMRPSKGIDSDGGLVNVLNIFRAVQAEYPSILLKLRTLVTARNMSDVIDIPTLLQDCGINLANINWKLYQVNEFVGERVETARSHAVHFQTFSRLGRQIIARWGGHFASITPKTSRESAERYMLVGPTGDLRSVKAGRRGQPYSLEIGNMRRELMEILMDIQRYPLELLPCNTLSPEARHLATRWYFL